MQHDDKESKKKLIETVQTDAALFSSPKDEKKSDSILDIPRIPFDANRHQVALNSGGYTLYTFAEEESRIDLKRLHAP